MIAKERSYMTINKDTIRIQISESSNKGIELRYALNVPNIEVNHNN